MKHLIGIIVLGLALSACEEEFAGNRPYNAEILNAPFQMRIVEIESTQYLAVLNSNFRFQQSHGNIQFFSLADPANPTLVSGLTVRLNGISSDFWLQGTRLYVVNRSLDQIEWYDYASGSFTQELDAAGDPAALVLSGNLQGLTYFERPGDNLPILAVAAFSAGTIFFVRIDGATPSLVIEPGPTEIDGVISVYRERTLVGAGLEMIPRQVTVEGRNDAINLSLRERFGRGVSEPVFLNLNSKPIVVAPLFTNLGLFSFRFDTWKNTTNYAWDLLRFRRDFRDTNGTRIPGSREVGFRGIATDQAGHVYLSNRADNGIYRLSFADLTLDSTGSETSSGNSRNTRGFPRNEQTFLISGLAFDSDLTDRNFPRLGALVTNCPEEVGPLTVAGCLDSEGNASGGAADVLWVLGLGSQKVYRVSGLTGTPEIEATSEALPESPQKILWHPTANLLYVTCLKGDRLVVLNATTLAVVKTL